MEISRRTDYGVRVILELASLAEDERACTHEIAQRQKIPGPFLAKIIAQLSLSGLVTTYRGAGGGVTLARPASEINLLDVLEALEGPLRLNRCVIDPDACPHEGKCPVHDIWTRAQADLAKMLSEATFDQLTNGAGQAPVATPSALAETFAPPSPVPPG
ncbi:MAG: Rrf2 family transcriptional regulator [Anaerolineae bacterium]|nr:Rrf2 family transcriptional regulator [Anaerolineae bacterium]